MKLLTLLVHARAGIDDLTGALDYVAGALSTADFVPDADVYRPLMDMVAKRGDVEGAEHLLEDFKSRNPDKTSAPLITTVASMHMLAGNMAEAEAAVTGLMAKYKQGKVDGDVTGAFNILLTHYALRRIYPDTVRIFRWMSEEKVVPDAESYTALLRILVSHRRLRAAQNVIRSAMPRRGLQPTAFHYAVVMIGYVTAGDWQAALNLHQEMIKHNVMRTVDSEAALIRATTLQESQSSISNRPKHAPSLPLSKLIKALRDVLMNESGIEALRESLRRSLQHLLASIRLQPSTTLRVLII